MTDRDQDQITHNQQLAHIASIEQTLHRLAAERTALRAALQAAAVALTPFAALYQPWMDARCGAGSRVGYGDAYITEDDVCQARAALAGLRAVARAPEGGTDGAD